MMNKQKLTRYQLSQITILNEYLVRLVDHSTCLHALNVISTFKSSFLQYIYISHLTRKLQLAQTQSTGPKHRARQWHWVAGGCGGKADGKWMDAPSGQHSN